MIREIKNRATMFSLSIRAAFPIVLLYSAMANATANEVTPKLPIGSSELLGVGGSLLIVIFAIIVLGVIYAKTQGLKSTSNGVINIVATQAIGPKERIAIVEVANKQLLIGMTTSSVQTLHVFDEPVAMDSQPENGFADRLRTMMRSKAE